MSLPSKILWYEGLTIGSQQLQQLDRYHEARLQRLTSVINPHLWGVNSVRWNLEGLAHNSLYADSMSLIFDDGEIYEAPFADDLPLTVDLNKLPADQQSFTFYAALPAMNAHGGNLAAPDQPHNGARYAAADCETLDLFGEAISANVTYLKKTVRLILEQESRDAYLSFPVVRIRRLASEGFEIDPAFMPPSVSIGAEPALLRLLESLLGKMTAKIDVLYSRHSRPRNDTIDVRSGDLSSFWMLNAITTGSAALSHISSYPHYHPVQLFRELMTLAGSLMAFSTKYTVTELPKYEHKNPAPEFYKLNAIIRDLIDTVIMTKYFKIPLTLDESWKTRRSGPLDPAKIIGTQCCAWR